MTDVPWTPGPWRWQGEDYRAGWGWQILVGPNGEGLIVGEGHDGKPFEALRAHMPLDPALCKTGMLAGPESANAVHVFSPANARLIAEAPAMAEALEELARLVEASAFNKGQSPHKGSRKGADAYWDAARKAKAILARIKESTP